jgi:hypothetical protein
VLQDALKLQVAVYNMHGEIIVNEKNEKAVASRYFLFPEVPQHVIVVSASQSCRDCPIHLHLRCSHVLLLARVHSL